MPKGPRKHSGSAAVILRNQDNLALPGHKYERVKVSELEEIEARSDGADVPRLVEEIKTLRSFIGVGLQELELYEKMMKGERN